MSILTDSSLGIKPVLTNLAQGYKNNAMVLERFLLPLNVDTTEFQYPVFSTEDFELYLTLRAPSSNALRMKFSASTVEDYVKRHAVENPIDDDERRENKWPIPIDQVGRTRIMNTLVLEKEFEGATILQTPGNYVLGNIHTCTGAAGFEYWGDPTVGDPYRDIIAGKLVISSLCGMIPNKMIMGEAAWNALINHDEIKARMTTMSGQIIVPSEVDIAKLFGLDEVIVGRPNYRSAGVLTPVWSDNVILGFCSDDLFTPSFGHVMNKTGWPLVRQYRQDEITSDIICYEMYYKSIICAWMAGYMIYNVIA